MRVEYKEVTAKRRFGVELEISANCSKTYVAQKIKSFEKAHGLKKPVKSTTKIKGWAETKENDYWHVKYDSTCGPLGKGKDYGWEIASYIASGHEDLFNIASAAGYLGESLETNKNCGLHIHVDVSDFSREDMGRLLIHWMRIEKCLFDISNISRFKNIYCKSMWSRLLDLMNKNPGQSVNSPINFWRLMQPHNLNTHNNDEKKYAINTVGFAIGQIVNNHSRKTVELRLPECQLNKDHVLGWTTLFLNFVDSSFKLNPIYPISPSPEITEVLKCLGLQGDDRFYLLGPYLFNAKTWFLQKLSETKIDYSFLKNDALKHFAFISTLS